MSSEPVATQNANRNGQTEGWVLNIERYTLHDGPGIRTTVFLKGCPLRCLWCSNPESQLSRPEIVYFEEKCTGCGRCLDVCPQEAILQEAPEAPVTVLFDRCDGCGRCVEACYMETLTLAGEKMTADDVVDIVARDLPFYEHSGGGLTLSGGEPLNQPEFTGEILRLAQEKGIHTAIQTSGQASLDSLKQVLAHVDLVIFDIKHLNPKVHQKLTGISNEQILDNLSYIHSMGADIVLQIPLIPGINDDQENLDQIIQLTRSMSSIQGLSVLAYHTLGVTKYRCTGRSYGLVDLEKPTAEYLAEKKTYFRDKGVPLVEFNG